jgi:hypothetical protein
MVDFERLDYKEYARFLDRPTEADVARWVTGNITSYADEAIAMRSKLYVFPDDPAPAPTAKAPGGKAPAGKDAVHKISYKYISAHRDRMREQLLKGGLRLAGVLNAVFQ